MAIIMERSTASERHLQTKSREKSIISSKTPGSTHPVLQLQEAVGNEAVSRLLRTGLLQAKLRVGQPGDIYEQEADRVAEQVIMMPGAQVQRNVPEEEEEIQATPEGEEKLQSKSITDSGLAIRRQSEEDEETLQGVFLAPVVQKDGEDEEEDLQAKGNSTGELNLGGEMENRVNHLRNGGESLPDSARDYFEPRFGADFGEVRIHHGPDAAEAARMVNARAFTVGQDVVFGDGEYAPDTDSGKKLMAHELTHVLQQKRGR